MLIKSVIYNIHKYLLFIKEHPVIGYKQIKPIYKTIFNWDYYNTIIESIKTERETKIKIDSIIDIKDTEITHLKTTIDKLKQEKEQSLMQTEDINTNDSIKLYCFY